MKPVPAAPGAIVVEVPDSAISDPVPGFLFLAAASAEAPRRRNTYAALADKVIAAERHLAQGGNGHDPAGAKAAGADRPSAAELGASARALREAGFGIIALKRGKDAKFPLHSRWRDALPSDSELYRDLSSERAGGIGFPGGALNNGIVPLDFDTEAAEAWWREQCEAAGLDPDDWPTVVTPGKVGPDGSRRPGRHRYVFDERGTLGNTEGELKHLGINVRGHGHCVLPPSSHPDGGRYHWAERHSFADFPDGVPLCPPFVYAAIERRALPSTGSPDSGAGTGTHRVTPDDRAYRYCRRSLDNARTDLARAPEGTRNNTLNEATFGLASLSHYAAFSEQEVRAAFRAACTANNWIPIYGDQSFDATFDSGWKAGLTQPRYFPDDDRSRARRASNGADDARRGGSIRAINVADFLALDIRPRDYILEPIMPAQGIAMLFSKRGVGKTYMALGVGYAVATGDRFLRYSAPRARRVVYIDGEMPASTMRERIAAIIAGQPDGAPEMPDPDFLRIVTPDLQTDPMPDLATREGQGAIEAELNGAELVILDNLSTLCRMGQENESQSWQPVQDWALSLRRRGISVLFVHHAGKGGAQRGTSKREDVLDTIIALRHPDDYAPVDGARFEVHLEKARGICGEAAMPFEAKMETRDGAAIWIVRDLQDVELSQAAELFRDGESVRDVAKALEISKSKAGRLRERAQEAGLLTRDGS